MNYRKLLTYMQTVRFLTDYLNGDTNYKITYSLHKLDRTRAQFKLLESTEEHHLDILHISGSIIYQSRKHIK